MIRVLIAKPGLDGHDRGAKVVAAALRDAGCEVIYTGLRATPEMIVNTAIQESVDVIGLSILSGAYNSICERVLGLMRKSQVDIPLVVGGVIPEQDRKALIEMGVSGVYGQEATLPQLVEAVKTLSKGRQMQLPTLYKKTSTGAIQYWKIWTENNVIKTAYGQVDGKEQITEDVIHEGKNIGRSNETTPAQQAELEAKSHWDKKKKKNYVEEIDRAENAETDVEGGLDVMLAHPYSKQGHKINWPAFAQPKLDGIRMIAIVEDGQCTLWTRTRKPITGIPHIQRELEILFPKGRHVFDGEAYNHAFKTDFEKIVSYVRQEEPIEGHEAVEYHIYDLPTHGTFAERFQALNRLIPNSAKYLHKVETVMVGEEEDALGVFEAFLATGYEGMILRNSAGLYVGKRSYDLQKVKEFDDAEFEIVDIEEGRGKLSGHVGAFVLKTMTGTLFKAKLRGQVERLKDYFENPELWKGKKLTVQYQGITGKEAVPRFPVGIAVRDYE